LLFIATLLVIYWLPALVDLVVGQRADGLHLKRPSRHQTMRRTGVLRDAGVEAGRSGDDRVRMTPMRVKCREDLIERDVVRYDDRRPPN